MIHTVSRVASFCIIVLLLVGCMGVLESNPTGVGNQAVTTVSISTEVPSPVAQATSAAQESSKTSDGYYKAGVDSYRKGDYKQAIKSFSEAIKTKSKSDYAPAFLMRAQVYRENGDYQKAPVDINQFIALKPNDLDGFYNRGDIYLVMGSYDKAIIDFEQTIKIKPDYVAAYVDRGLAFANKGNYASAIADDTQAIKLNPNIWQAYYNRGRVYYLQHKWDQAFADYDQAIILNPKNGLIYFQRGIAHRVINQKGEAIADFRKCVELCDQFAKHEAELYLQVLGVNP